MLKREVYPVRESVDMMVLRSVRAHDRRVRKKHAELVLGSALVTVAIIQLIRLLTWGW